MRINRTEPKKEISIPTDEKISQLENENKQLKKALEEESLKNEMNGQAIVELSMLVSMGGL